MDFFIRFDYPDNSFRVMTFYVSTFDHAAEFVMAMYSNEFLASTIVSIYK